MIPNTKNGLPALVCVSAMQKYIRRGDEVRAMEFACELIHTSKAFHSMVCKRLEIISHEDIDTEADPRIVPFVKAAVEQSKAWYHPKKVGGCRMPIGNAIRMMCRAKKSREGDHFQAAVGLKSILEGYVPEVPDFAYDQHTAKGKRMGRGLAHFREEGSKLEPAPEPREDRYAAEAYRLWAIKRGETEEMGELDFDGEGSR